MRYLVICLLLTLGSVSVIADVSAAGLAIQKGRQVAFDYTLTIDGKVVDSSEGKKPLEYVQGEGKIIPGLAKQMEGLRAGDERTITVKPEEAYGAVNPKAIQEVSRSAFPPEAKFTPGMQLEAKSPSGQPVVMRVVEVKPNSVVMDFNHPLAGKTLVFAVKIVSVK